jgi:toxin-antitoxin system PIN domain toxin
MTFFFLDVNVWLALSDVTHVHHREAWQWFSSIGPSDRLIFCRQTQIGLLRLLTNQAVMNHAVLTLGEAWDVYDDWLLDPRVQFHPEPHGLDLAFREVTAPFSKLPASKAVGDSYFLAFARQSGASLVTFDQALKKQARKVACASVIPR